MKMKSLLTNTFCIAILLLTFPLSSQDVSKADLYLRKVLDTSIATGKADEKYFDLVKVKESIPSDCIAARYAYNEINPTKFRVLMDEMLQVINKDGKSIGVNWKNIEYLKSEITYFNEGELGDQESAKGYFYFLSAGKRYRIRFKQAIINPESNIWVGVSVRQIEKI